MGQTANHLPAKKDHVGSNADAHSRRAELFFHVRVARHRFWRAIADFFGGLRRCEKMPDGPYSVVVVSLKKKLWTDSRAAEAAYQNGKVQNLKTAVQELDCALLLPGQVFSFWKQVGRATEGRGYVVGRMLQQGCMIPAVGGGLCQLSNALYAAALQSGCEIVERHAHSRVVPGSAAAVGRDATVAWNYGDLRFVTSRPLRLSTRLDREDLVVALRGNGSMTPAPVYQDGATAMGAARPCGSCGEADCFMHGR